MTRTLADMTEQERWECVGRWCETSSPRSIGVLGGLDDEHQEASVLYTAGGDSYAYDFTEVSPRYDLPRAWTAEGEPVPLPEPDADGRWRLAGHFTLHLDGDLAVIRAKWGPVATIPTDRLQHIGDVMHAAANTHRKENP